MLVCSLYNRVHFSHRVHFAPRAPRPARILSPCSEGSVNSDWSMSIFYPPQKFQINKNIGIVHTNTNYHKHRIDRKTDPKTAFGQKRTRLHSLYSNIQQHTETYRVGIIVLALLSFVYCLERTSSPEEPPTCYKPDNKNR